MSKSGITAMSRRYSDIITKEYPWSMHPIFIDECPMPHFALEDFGAENKKLNLFSLHDL